MIPSSSQILLPVRMSTIFGSFALALFLNFLPWPDLRLVPDFVALVLAFLAVWLSRRILWFGPMLQSLHIALILLVTQAAVLVIRLGAGDHFPGWPILVAPVAGAILWPAVTSLLLRPQRRREREQAI